MNAARESTMEADNSKAPPDDALRDADPLKCVVRTKKRGFLAGLGPGLITGASDDDPSGIGTYSQAGAYGYGLLWTMVFSLPLMAAIQEISARIGRVTGRGLAGNIRRHYPAWLLYPIVLLLVLANTINLGADIGAMGDAVALLIGGPALLYAGAFAVGCVLLQVFASYPRCSKVLKWLTLVLFSYVATAFTVHVPWRHALVSAVHPSLQSGGEYWAMFIAILGTTISPYLFFWQASQETEEIRINPDEHSLKKAPSRHGNSLAGSAWIPTSEWRSRTWLRSSSSCRRRSPCMSMALPISKPPRRPPRRFGHWPGR